MKPIIISETNIVNDAARFSQKLDVLTSISKSIELELMRKRMMCGQVVKFLYLRAKDNTPRMAIGTLQEDAVAANVKGTGCNRRQYGQFCYIDLIRLAWRSFKIENFVGIID